MRFLGKLNYVIQNYKTFSKDPPSFIKYTFFRRISIFVFDAQRFLFFDDFYAEKILIFGDFW